MARPRLADRVLERLLRELAEGTWPAASRLPPTRQLAAEFGVSLRPLQAAIREAGRLGLLDVAPRQPVFVRPEAAERARQLVRERSARPASRRLAVLTNDPRLFQTHETYWSQVFRSIMREATKHGIKVEPVRWPVATQFSFAKQLRMQGYGAALAIGIDAERLASLMEMARVQFPVLLHNRWIPWLGLPSLMRDDYHASQRIGQKLQQLGHRRMCFLSPTLSEELYGGRGRIKGWMDFVDQAGLLETCVPPVCYVNTVAGALDSQVRHMLEGPGAATAVVFASEALAKSILEHPRFAHMRVPEALSVATFDSPAEIRVTATRPPLTSITLDMTRAAECAVEMIEAMLSGNRHPPNIRVPLEINITDSIGPASE